MSPPEPDLPLGDRALLSLVLYACVMSLYFGAGSMAGSLLVDLGTPLDDRIPFVPEAMPAYALAYLTPLSLLFVERTASGIARMTRAALLAYAIAAPFFLVMPVRDADPPLEPENVLQEMLLLNRGLDRSHNAFPSMHVGLATLLALIGARRSRAWALALGGAAVVIAVSTLLVKQHFLVDLPAGALVGVVAFRVVYGEVET